MSWMLCTHRWELRGARTVYLIDPAYERTKTDATRVLYVCTRCGKAKTARYLGSWTDGELEGTRP